MENSGFILGQLIGCIILGIALEGVISLPYYMVISIKNRFIKNYQKKNIKFKKNSTYYFAHAFKYTAIGVSIWSLQFFEPVHSHSAEIAALVVISGIIIFLIYRFCNRLEQQLQNQT